MPGICFKQIEDSVVIIRQSHMYKQCKVYERNGFLYAGIGSSFARMREDGATSNPKISWEEIEGCGSIKMNKVSGRWLSMGASE